jgi:YD repeat-containing protein
VNAQRGFTLLDVSLAIVLAVVLGLATLGVLRGLFALSAAAATASGGSLTLDQTSDEMRSDAETAFAVFVPTQDVMRRPNSGASGAHEIDFYTRTDTGQIASWAYFFDAAAHTLRRFDYDAAGHVGEATRANGTIDTTARYPALTGVTGFRAQTLQASELIGAENVYASAIAPALGGLAPKALPVGFAAPGDARGDRFGGNVTVQIAIATEHGSRTLHLATAALPSGFTVRAYPQIRAIVYRIDQTHRFWFGLAGKSHVFVRARLDISYDGWRTQPPQTWCDFNLYGYPDGLTGGPAEDYHPEWFTESTAGIVYDVTHGETPGATCPAAPPPPASAGAAAPTAAPSAIVDTPPPCFASGSCWPPDAPPDWSPSPAPIATPPIAWCATHPVSRLCGGPGPPPVLAPE